MNKSVGKLTREIDKQVYEVMHGNNNIFDLPRGKKERFNALRTFVFKECEKAWSQLPREIATLKRQYLRELIENLES